jgi:hypothetical protein
MEDHCHRADVHKLICTLGAQLQVQITAYKPPGRCSYIDWDPFW